MNHAYVKVTGAADSTGNALQSMLLADDIQPGSEPSYQLCKTIYVYHPLGAKMVEAPLTLAQSQKRIITVSDSPEERVVNAFIEEWDRLKADALIFNVMRVSRVYGAASVVYLVDGVPPNTSIPPFDLYKYNLRFNVLDPLNTSGSLVLSQDPNAPDFQKPFRVSVAGQPYNLSRSAVQFNEDPIYIQYTTSAFGYVGRSVYQRALFPLKSYVQSMLTDDQVTKKAGVLVAFLEQAGSVADKLMSKFKAFKRNLLKEAQTDNVISIGQHERIESLNLENTDTAMTTARSNIIENIAAAAGMPAYLLRHEALAQGFGEGSEDAKAIAAYVDSVRKDMRNLYAYFDRIVMLRAWNPNFYAVIQQENPELYGGMPYEQAFYKWEKSFSAKWPSLLTEPESKRIEVDDVRMKSLLSMFQTLNPGLSADGAGEVLRWLTANLNETTSLFKHKLVIDIDEYVDFREQEIAREILARMLDSAEQSAKTAPGFVGRPGEAEKQLGETTPENQLSPQRLGSLSWDNH
ncbi:anti-CBASS protein Acb1 family protein [Paraburkholderia terrae]|uniref:anti-CBASS protein Acb1 family protein n=1 Tax=Paraburkholderia terrae TaxID=311230 RepID=UPI001EE31242|nr:anti-CBASS Acb1 family protein [Paraburkholderia terrae]GJH02264.1 DUF1073 domain-containing protein [Paraburkholderia terrae]